MTGSILLSSIRSDCWQSLYDLLQTGVYSISTNNIHGSLNNQLVEEEGYPQVIIERPKVSNFGLTFNKKLREADVSFVIRVYQKSGVGVMNLSDEVMNKILLGKNVLSGKGLKNINFPEGDNDSFSEGKSATIHVEIINVTARFIG